MKKLLILIVVLGMASMANATLQISVNGDPEPIDSEIVVTEVPSGMLTLDIWTDADIAAMDSFDWALVVDSTKGTISGGVDVVDNPDFINEVGGDAPDPGNGILPDEPLAGRWGFMASFIPISAGTVLLDDFLFHCEGEGDAVIQLWATVSGEPFGPISGGTLMDQVIVHQIPEPMTMALLGLGGLFLRRRK